MSTTLTLKNIPADLYEKLKQAAQIHRRSLNSEVLVCMETVLQPHKATPIERLRRIRQLRHSLPPKGFTVRDIDAFKRTGRK